ncbi:hypothetical protein BJV78DRAFT_944318 [Lactifluus subvellereus]|nr:hypothetical protein BJV78DRAFT_944318 [Lactifluus subvellereus]
MPPQPPSCSVGVAFHTVPDFPIQWALVLSKSERFEGKVWCSTLNETTNGRGAFWTHLDWSPSRLNPAAVFSGVIGIARSSQSVNTVQSSVPLQSIVSEVDCSQGLSWEDIGRDSEKYVGLALVHLCEGGLISLPGTDPATLPNLIRGRLQTLLGAHYPGRGSYPVVALKTGRITYARARLLN